jgi:hypothetical protein
MRYDPSLAVGSRFAYNQAATFVHGIAADDKGFVWGSGYEQGVIRVNGDDPSQYVVVPTTPGHSSKGMAVDLDGKIWSINRDHNTATVITPGAGLNDQMVENGAVTNLVEPYTYSDMTGAQLRFATNQRGYYRRIFEGCPDSADIPKTIWDELRWDVSTPGGSKVKFLVRLANTRAELDAQSWFDIAQVPSDTSPFDLATALEAAGLQGSRFIQIEAQLISDRDAQDNIWVPTLRALAVTRTCPRILR